MKKKSMLVMFVISFNLCAQVDYRYCSKFVNDTNASFQKTGFAFPFKVDAKTGKLTTINHNMSYNGEKKGEHVYSSNGFTGKVKILVKRNDLNDIGEITVESNTQTPGAPPKVLTKITFDIKNNKCIPVVAHKSTNFNGNDIKGTLFDTELCKKIEDYFDSNKNLNRCFDPKSKENLAMKRLLERNGYNMRSIVQKVAPFTPVMNRYMYSIEQKILTGSSEVFDFRSSNTDKENKEMLGVLGGSPLISGHMILNDCYDRGLKPLLLDDSVWTQVRNEVEGEEREGVSK